MNPANLGQQFGGGPEAIRTRDFQQRHAEAFDRLDRSLAALGHVEEEQGHLFDPSSVPPPEPHTQTPQQFAADPRTWWHGRFTGPRGKVPGGGGEEGFHAGTIGAARRRLEANFARMGEKPGKAGHLFPLRLTGPVSSEIQDEPEPTKKNPFNKSGGNIKHTALGEPGLTHGYLYRNVVESPGSISVGVPRRKGFLSTYRESIEQAQAEGKKVHPLISWAAKKHPEHTGEVYPKPRYSRYDTPAVTHTQMGLAESLPTHEGYEFQQKAFPPTEKVERRSYETEGHQKLVVNLGKKSMRGNTVFVKRTRESGEGTALMGPQWEPDWSRM